MYPKDHLDNWFRGQGKWKHVSKKKWKDWKWQLKNRYLTVDKLTRDLKLTPSEEGCSLSPKRWEKRRKAEN